MASGTRSTCRPPRRPRWAAWPATTPAAAAASPTATWCTTCWARGLDCPTACCTSSAASKRPPAPRARMGERVQTWPLACARDRGALAQGAAPRGRLQPGRLPQPEPRAVHRRRQRQPGAPAGGQRRHAGPHRSLTLQLSPTAERQGAGRGELPDLLQGDGHGPAHRQAGSTDARGGTGRPHHDRAVAAEPAFAPTVRSAR
jgi:hypothetical protein